MNLWKWFYPGLGLKRWFSLLAFSIFIAAVGILLMVEKLKLEGLKSLLLVLVNIPGNILFIVFIGVGALLFLYALRRIFAVFFRELFPNYRRNKMEAFRESKFLRKGPRIVVIGGGTGLSTLLRGLKEYTSNLTAIVTVADDGGSSGRLREELGVLPPGDIRNCLVALADKEDLMEKTLEYRFADGGNLEGHNLGNLFLVGLNEICDGEFDRAIREMSRILAIRGKVLPVTLEKISLTAELADGTLVRGESNISRSSLPIKKLAVEPAAEALPDALEAIRDAELIVLGPGSLYTSILPVLLVGGIKEEIKNSQAERVYVCNVMTQPGETGDFTAADHLEVLYDNDLAGELDYILVNNRNLSDQVLKAGYLEEGAKEVIYDRERLETLGIKIIAAPFLEEQDTARHNPVLLADHLLRIWSRSRKKVQRR